MLTVSSDAICARISYRKDAIEAEINDKVAPVRM